MSTHCLQVARLLANVYQTYLCSQCLETIEECTIPCAIPGNCGVRRRRGDAENAQTQERQRWPCGGHSVLQFAAGLFIRRRRRFWIATASDGTPAARQTHCDVSYRVAPASIRAPRGRSRGMAVSVLPSTERISNLGMTGLPRASRSAHDTLGSLPAPSSSMSSMSSAGAVHGRAAVAAGGPDDQCCKAPYTRSCTCSR